MSLNEILEKRRSIRKYQDRPVEADALKAVVEAGRLAPSACNRQEWRFIAVTDAALRAKIMGAYNGRAVVRQAPVLLVAVSTAGHMMSCGQDAASIDSSIALTCMMLKATELGLGTCWLGGFSADEVKEILGLPASEVVVALMPLGYAAEAPAPRPRKALEEVFEIR